MDLIKSELGYDKIQALGWLQDQGLIGDNRPRSPGHSLNRTTPHYHPSANKLLTASTESSAEQKQKYVRQLWSESSCIPVDPQHPARRWFAHRNLWHPDFSITPTLDCVILKITKQDPASSQWQPHCKTGSPVIPRYRRRRRSRGFSLMLQERSVLLL